ncbi:hypothetical protein ACIQ6R_13230 [Streptomyces sp. NPDC096048]|uniref:hypothetical protein n=1 Tax=Streptomyces sp. NPDC096048 TaxID=3366072 RepID=UPI0037FBC175
MSEQQRDLTPQPNQILAEPATPQACAADLRTATEQQTAAGAARDQAVFARINAAR